MQTSDEAVDGIYSEEKDLEFQIQLGSKLYPEYPCRSMTECFYHLRKALNLFKSLRLRPPTPEAYGKTADFGTPAPHFCPGATAAGSLH